MTAILACKSGNDPEVTASGPADPSGQTTPDPDKYVEPPPPAETLPTLRLGHSKRSELAEAVGTIAAQATANGHHYLEIRVPLTGNDMGLDFDLLHVELSGAAPGDLAVAQRSPDANAVVVHIRRTNAAAPEPAGTLFAQRWAESGREWVKVPFRCEKPGEISQDPALPARWVASFSAALGNAWNAPNAWAQFASGRIYALLPGGLKPGRGNDNWQRPPARTDLTLLMDTTTGVLSMQEALQHDRGLRLQQRDEPRTIPIASLRSPPLDPHPFPAMQAQLPKPDAGVAEPLAAAVPAEFWYARVDDIRLLLRLLDEADTWITPIVQVLQQHPEDRHLADRYQTQLGLQRSDLARLFGHTVVGPVAISGSDPYLREGSDVTLIFTVKEQTLFDQELARQLDAYRTRYPDLATTTQDHNGVQITIHRDPGANVHQVRAQVDNLAFVSNSPAACMHILDAVAGKTPRLGDEDDLKYMLARDPGTHQAFAFLSDKFIAAVIGPQQKIAASRRQQALAELLTPGFAALLYGWLHGQAPATTQDLVASGLLVADELKHGDGTPIEFTPGTGAYSPWGRPSALTPLIDLAPVTMVSAAEQTAYAAFVGGYQQYWQQFIDPVAIRLDIQNDQGTATADVSVRILPLISATDYSDIEAIVGSTRVTVGDSGRGVQAVWAVGKDARLRSDLDGLMRAATGKSDIGLGWLGDWVVLGVTDRAALLELLARFDDTVQLPPPRTTPGGEFQDLELWRQVGRFPVYAAAEVKNPAMLIATLTAIRTMLGEVAPGWIDWGEVSKHRDLPIVRVGINRSTPLLPNRDIADAVALHYIQTGTAIVLALDQDTLKTVTDRLLAGQLPKTDTAGPSQFVVQGQSAVGAPLWTALLWLIQGQANGAQDSARRVAEAVLRGDPTTQTDANRLAQVANAYFGFTPVTAHGTTQFTLASDGAGDPVLGTTIFPNFVALPISGSPVERLMQRLTGLRGEVAFDKEPDAAGPTARSLYTRFRLQLGPAQ